MPKKVTIYDVAAEANVSPSTVSRYLNRTSYIVKEKVDAIEAAIFTTGFKPRKRKTSSKKVRNMKLGILVPSYDVPFTHRLLSGVNLVLSQTSYELIIETTMWDRERELKELQAMVNSELDAIIMVCGLATEAKIKEITEDLPVLLVLREQEGIFPVINIDNELGGYVATTHLIQRGHRNIVHVRGAEDNIDANQRFAGYKRALASAGIKYDPRLVIDGAFESQLAMESMMKLCKEKRFFTAVFAGNDLSALGAMQGLDRSGLKIPNNVSVVGFDDLPICEYYIPRLTTIKSPLSEIGEIATKYVLDLISNNPTEYEIPPIEIIHRNSVAMA